MGNQVIDESPLIESHSSYVVKRTGNAWSAVAHIITALIGAGVLSLSWSVAQLGWIAGPLVLILFAITTLVQSSLLCDCYRFPDPEYGTIRTSSYIAAVKLYLGETKQKVAGVMAYVDLFGTAAAYVITTATSTK
ncbi:hypothetical protein L6164_029565 [Bauhinia variegata]|nr:hypothetical protein L6164_029565 [Bauhinia variegata]